MKPSFHSKDVTCPRCVVSTRKVKKKEMGRKRKEKEKILSYPILSFEVLFQPFYGLTIALLFSNIDP